MRPELDLDEVQEGDDVARAQLRAWGFTEEEKVEELEADGVALEIEAVARRGSAHDCVTVNPGMATERTQERKRWKEKTACLPLLKILNVLNPPLRIVDHLREQVCKARLAQL